MLPEATRAVAERVAPALPQGVALSCSPLSRCSDLAQAIVALRPDLGVARDPRIAEMDLGEWEEQLWSAIDRTEIDAWTRDFAHTRAGGSGECTRQFMQRVGEAFDAWRAGGRDAVWITHAGVIRCAWLLRDGIRAVERSESMAGSADRLRRVRHDRPLSDALSATGGTRLARAAEARPPWQRADRRPACRDSRGG